MPTASFAWMRAFADELDLDDAVRQRPLCHIVLSVRELDRACAAYSSRKPRLPT